VKPLNPVQLANLKLTLKTFSLTHVQAAEVLYALTLDVIEDDTPDIEGLGDQLLIIGRRLDAAQAEADAEEAKRFQPDAPSTLMLGAPRSHSTQYSGLLPV
jgi:hypothetical protein